MIPLSVVVTGGTAVQREHLRHSDVEGFPVFRGKQGLRDERAREVKVDGCVAERRRPVAFAVPVKVWLYRIGSTLNPHYFDFHATFSGDQGYNSPTSPTSPDVSHFCDQSFGTLELVWTQCSF